MANKSPEITQATGSDEEGTIGKRRFTFFSRHKESKSKKDAEKERGKVEEDARMRSKTLGGGEKPKTKKAKEKSPKAESKRSKHEQKKKERKKDRKNMRTLMIGLDFAGKTTPEFSAMLYKLKDGQCISTIPTCGFNVETVKYNKIKFTIWDVGGQDTIRPIWRHYFANTDALVFVVDSRDRERIDEARQEFHRAIQDEEMKDAIILVLANKQDLPFAMNAAELAEKMGLHKLCDREWYIHPTCATSGDGLYEGLEWLSSQHLAR